MNCAICGKDNQAGTRFCVHCGAALAAPAGGSRQSTIATAGAILAPKPPPAPSVPSSVPSATSATTPPHQPGAASAAAPPAEPAFMPPEVEPAPAIPAYDANPKKAGWVVIAIAVAGLVCVGGYMGYKAMTGGDVKDTLTRIEAPGQTPAASPASPATPSVVAEEPKPAPGQSPRAGEGRAPVSPPDAEPAPPPPREAEPAPLPPPKAPPKAPRSTPTTRPPIVAQPPPAPTPPPAVRAAPSPSATPAAVPVPDRWAQFAADLHRCEREVFLNRVICDQRVRLRYCDGYWGKVPQCPGGIANPDRGQ